MQGRAHRCSQNIPTARVEPTFAKLRALCSSGSEGQASGPLRKMWTRQYGRDNFFPPNHSSQPLHMQSLKNCNLCVFSLAYNCVLRVYKFEPPTRKRWVSLRQCCSQIQTNRNTFLSAKHLQLQLKNMFKEGNEADSIMAQAYRCSCFNGCKNFRYRSRHGRACA